MHSGIVGGLLSQLDQLHVQLVTNLENHFFDSTGMNPAVDDQRLQGASGHFSPNRIEAGNDHRVRGVVDDDVHAGGGFERPDVPSFATDDAAFHLIAR